MISHRLRKANNPYMSDYDPAQPTKYLTYLDANNLYGWAMHNPCPLEILNGWSQKRLRKS